VVLQRQRWPRSAIFEWLARTGAIAEAEMYRTFNCGIGMIAVVAAERADQALQLLDAARRTGHADRGSTARHTRRRHRGVMAREKLRLAV
jgi:phosphoribosylaminoimidazole (AIR) synthetase